MTSKEFHTLRFEGNSFFINQKTPFSPIGKISSKGTNRAKIFANKMTFQKEGEHREHRTGGTISRPMETIYRDTFQGKLAEVAFYEYLQLNKIESNTPDFRTYKKGKWDSFDFIAGNKKLNVKSTKHFGNLLLLESGDWNDDAEYVPNLGTKDCIYDFFILIRINSDNLTYDIPGFIERKEFREIIINRQIVKKSSLLNGKMPLDAENYYIQSGDLTEIELLKEKLD